MNMKNMNKNEKGRLRIGDDWNAITIIALSQNNPLKAIAEFVENSIDAHAYHITIARGKENGHQYLKISDDGNGIPCAAEGAPDFKYVATHICDSLKRRLKQDGLQGIQGEFGIGLLSFWTVGHKLSMVSAGKDGKVYQMVMEKGKPGYTINNRAHLLPAKGVQLAIAPLLEGMRFLNGEKIHRYLASELRDRIRISGVKIKVIDRASRMEFEVQPRQYSGQLLHNLPQPATSLGDLYVELYLNEKSPDNCISLCRSGTRVLPAITILDEFQSDPWNSGYFEGIIDAPFLTLTPGTRDGIIRDDKFSVFCGALKPIKDYLSEIVQEQSKVEDEHIARNILRSVQKALKEAILALPREEYDWFNICENSEKSAPAKNERQESLPEENSGGILISQDVVSAGKNDKQKEFFEFAGPLFLTKIYPASAIVQVGALKSFRATGLDRSRRRVETVDSFAWAVVEGKGSLDKDNGEIIVFQAPPEPGLTKLKVVIKQGETVCEAEAVITVVDSLIELPAGNSVSYSRGLPGYTLESAPGQLWRSRYEEKRNIIIINSGHRDFLYSAGLKPRKLRYICRLFSKELILHNFVGLTPDQLLERFVELSLYTEDNLK